ncbi:MAG TPA: hypothetical protein VHP14_25720, partial [Anaerolineales bacterium]|nr:hypothetical protein [Anaerolineales bacterium]
MLKFRQACVAFFSILFLVSACTSSVTSTAGTPTAPLKTTKASATRTPGPAVSSLKVEKEALRGVQLKVWHPWFGAQASLFESQVGKFNKENEWGIFVSTERKSNYSELFLQTGAAFEDFTNPQIVI